MGFDAYQRYNENKTYYNLYHIENLNGFVAQSVGRTYMLVIYFWIVMKW